MGRHEFSDDPELPLNKLATRIIHTGIFWDSEIYFSDVVEWLREAYQMGFSDGEAFVWASRSGKYIDRDGNPVDIIKNPRMEGPSE